MIRIVPGLFVLLCCHFTCLYCHKAFRHNRASWTQHCEHFIAAFTSALVAFSPSTMTYSHLSTNNPRCHVLLLHLLQTFKLAMAQAPSQEEQCMTESPSTSRRGCFTSRAKRLHQWSVTATAISLCPIMPECIYYPQIYRYIYANGGKKKNNTQQTLKIFSSLICTPKCSLTKDDLIRGRYMS